MGNTFSLDKVEHRKCNILSSGSVLLDPPSIREWRQGDDSDAWHAIITTPPFQVETSWTTAYRWAMALPKQLTFLEGAAAKALQAAFIVEHAIRTKRERIHDILIADYEAMQTVIQSAGRLWSSSRNVARQKFGTLDLMRKLYGERLSQEVVADRFLVALKTVQERSQRAQNVVNTAFSSFCEGSDILSPWSPCYSLIEGAKNRWRSASRLEWSARWGRWVETLPPSHKIEWQPRALLKRSKPAPKIDIWQHFDRDKDKQGKRQAADLLVREFLAKGGKVITCLPGLNHYARSRWSVSKINADMLQPQGAATYRQGKDVQSYLSGNVPASPYRLFPDPVVTSANKLPPMKMAA